MLGLKIRREALTTSNVEISLVGFEGHHGC